MSDVSKTNAVLLEEAKRLIADCSTYNFGLRTANRLAHKVAPQLVDALEAATRVPVQGEPDACLDHKPVQHRDGKPPWCNACKRTSVPDAATEELKDIAETHAFCADRLFLETELVDEIRSERDAALAAIERVRAALDTAWVARREPQGPDSWYAGVVHARAQILAALDGAPEPEVLELPETGLEVRDSDGDLISTGEHRRVLHQGGYVCDTCVNDLGLNVRWDRAGFIEGHPFPVEGESKP